MNQPKKILLVQLFSNGDCLYATSIAHQIKLDFPGCHLTWVIAGYCKDIIKLNPYVDDVLVTEEVPKNDVVKFRRFKRKIAQQKREGKWDQVFITHNMDENQALYDGTVRGMVLRAYPLPVKVPLQPVLVLSEDEKRNVEEFVSKHQLHTFRNVILWEFAPQSGQSILQFELVKNIAKKLTALPGTCVILSSANTFEGTSTIIDASTVSVRENAGLTHYCTLLIGCSSGITWLSTSTAAKALPMLQLLDPAAYFMNAPSVDFKRYGIEHAPLIEIFDITENKVYETVRSILEEGFESARSTFNEIPPVQFNTTRKVVYNLLCYLHIRSVMKHYRIMKSIYGRHPLLVKQFILGILGFPFKLISNKLRKGFKG
jgi:hypothetical protein